MPNVVKYTTDGTPSGCLTKGNMMIGNNTADYGTTFYNGIDPPSGGYTIYLNKASGGPSIVTASNDAQLIYWTRAISGNSYETAAQCLSWFLTQTDKVCVNENYPGIVTNGLLYLFDASFSPSYPTSGASWYSLGSKWVSGSLSNNPAYSSAKGTIDFDGADDYFGYSNGGAGRLGFTNSITMSITIMFPGTRTGASDALLLGFDLTTGTQLNFYRNNGWPTDYYGLLVYTTSPWNYVNEWAYFAPGRFYTSVISLAADGTYYLMQNNTILRSGQLGPNFVRWYVNFNELGCNGRGLAPVQCSYKDIKLYDRGLTLAEIRQNYHQGPIVTSNLVLALDPGNVVSYYDGAGTNWYDMISTNNSTLSNGPTYSIDGGGSIVFDGSDDYSDFTAPSLTTTTTVEVWAKIGAGYSGKMIFGWGNYDVWCGGGNLGYNTANADIYGITAATVSSLGLVNNWKHYVFEMRSDVSYSNNKMYINGVLQSLSQVQSTENVANRNFNSGNGRISGWRADTGYPMPMNCSSFRVYNRALTQSEVLQNFAAQRTRYGI